MALKIEQLLIPVGVPARPGTKLSNIDTITIHWIGPYPRQAVETPRNWWLTGPSGKGMQASAHFIVKDDRCIQCLPIDEIGWHAGDGARGPGNTRSIGIEVIPMNEAGEFSERTIATLKELIATLPKVPLVRHYEWTKKDCPRFYTPHVVDGDARWDSLKEQLNGKEIVSDVL